jgi:uncharacterized protein (DUF305 family)
MKFAFIALLFLAACTSHGMMGHPQVTSEEVFIAEMIPHHQEAVDSSREMLSSENPEIRTLAQEIIAAQEKEIAMMRGWMSDWYPGSAYAPKYVEMMPDLSNLEGAVRDRAYLEGMQEHHEGAIQMARQAQGLELRPEVRKLTDDIITTQAAEIDRMEALLAG